MSELDRNILINMQIKLDKLDLRKARGAYIRWMEWIKEGEKNTAYFCGVEIRRQERNATRYRSKTNICRSSQI